MKACLPILAMISLAAMDMPLASANDGIYVAHRESLQNLDITYAVASEAQKPGIGNAGSLQFEAFSKRFDLELSSNHALLNAEQRLSLDANIGIYRGALAGVDGSWVRLVIVDGLPQGMIWDGQELYAVEAAADGEVPTIFRLKDMEIAPGALSCSTFGSDANGQEMFDALAGELSATVSQAPGATSQLDMAIIGDFEFATAKGASAQSDLIARMNNVDGIYSSQLGVQLNAKEIDVFTSANDPFSDTAGASSLNSELANYRDATPAQHATGLSHLFTGRNFAGSTVGYAFVGSVCSKRSGTGVTQATHSLTTDSLIAAHEIGHNFGARHDGDNAYTCPNEPTTFLMAPFVNGSDEFSPCSLNIIQASIANASCVTALPGTDVAVVSGAQPPPALLGDTASVTFTINSVGTDEAADVVAGITIPTAVTLAGATASSGTCSIGAGTANCSIGSIAAGTGVDVTLDVETTAVGNADFAATVSATSDANSNNNQITTQLTIDPAVDLVSMPASTAQLIVNQGETIRPMIENSSSIAATGVSITITPDSALQIDGASWSPGTCSIAAGVATCQATSLAAQSTTTIDLQVTGTSEGDVSYSMSASASETDRDTANNDASGQVSVGPVPPPPAPAPASGGGGGGALGGLFITLLVLSRLALRIRTQALLTMARLRFLLERQ